MLCPYQSLYRICTSSLRVHIGVPSFQGFPMQIFWHGTLTKLNAILKPDRKDAPAGRLYMSTVHNGGFKRWIPRTGLWHITFKENRNEKRIGGQRKARASKCRASCYRNQFWVLSRFGNWLPWLLCTAWGPLVLRIHLTMNLPFRPRCQARIWFLLNLSSDIPSLRKAHDPHHPFDWYHHTWLPAQSFTNRLHALYSIKAVFRDDCKDIES